MNGETYLRLLVERVLDEAADQPIEDPHQAGRWLAELHRASEALRAAGKVNADTAEAIRADLTLALALRGPAPSDWLEPQQLSRWHRFGPAGPAAGAMPSPGVMRRTVRGCAADLETPDGVVHVQFMVFRDDRAGLYASAVAPGGPPAGGAWATASAGSPPTLGVINVHRRVWTGSGPPSLSPPPSRLPRPVPPGASPPQPPTVRAGPPRPPGSPGGYPVPSLHQITAFDDDGRQYQAMGGASSGDGNRWAFQFHLRPPPPEDAPALWFEAGGGTPVRVPLAAPSTGIRVGAVEDVPEAERWSPAERYLVESGQRSFHWWQRSLAHGGEPAPPVDDSAIDALVATDAINPASPAIAMRNALSRVRPGQAAPPGLPDQWAAVLANLAADDGRVSTVVLGVALPRLADRDVWLDALTSEPDAWRVHAFLRPGISGPGPGPFGRDEPSLTASDDRGGFYVAVIDRGGGDPDGLAVDYRFVPRLDPLARALTVHATSGGRRVSATVPLP